MKKGSIAAAAVPFASKIVLGSGENMVKLPKFVSGGEPTEYFKAPKEWDEHRKQAKHVQEKINDQFGNAPNVIGLGLSQSKKTYGGKNGLKVTVRIDEEAERPPSELPEQVEGIPIATEAGLKGNLGGCSVSNGTENCVNKESDTTVNPGERINNGTAAMRMIDSNNDEYILTVAHLFESNCPNDVNGQTATTADGTKIGTVKYSNGVDDWAVVELNSDGNTSAVIDDNADFPTCVDSVSEAYLQEWESRWKSNRPCLYQMGCTTGKTSGRLKYANYTESDFNCATYDDDGSADGVYTYCGFGQGDSGGPTWHMENGNAHLVSTTAMYYGYSGSVCSGNDFGPDSSGFAAYAVEDKLYGFIVD